MVVRVAIENGTQRAVLGVSAFFATLAISSVALRFWARKVKQNPVKVDDWCILVALILALGLVSCDMTGVIVGGVGLHVTDIEERYGPDPITSFLKDLVAVQILWATSLAMTKASILLFYMRIFDVADRHFRIVSRVAIVAIFLWCMSVILCGFLLCRPFAYNWDQSIPGGHCNNQILSYILTGSFNIVTDILVLCLPIPMIRKLQMPFRTKVALTLIFAIGFFICVISIVRTITLVKVSYTDITYSVPIALIWSMMEPTLAITIACVPIMRPLFKGMMSTNKGASGSGSGHDSHNFQNIDEQHLFPLGNIKQKTFIKAESKDADSLRTNSNNSDDAVNFRMPEDPNAIGAITVKREFSMKTRSGLRSLLCHSSS
ncbi:hypothetical protein V1524DRAFT_457636 [Lipomyces starkeyi]